MSPSDAHGPQASIGHMQPTLDDHWRKELRETTCDYIAISWYDASIPFDASHSPYYGPIFDALHATGNRFEGPTMHDLSGYHFRKKLHPLMSL